MHTHSMGTHTQIHKFLHDLPVYLTVAAVESLTSCSTWSHSTRNVERGHADKAHHFKNGWHDTVCSCSLMNSKGSHLASRKLVFFGVAILLCCSHYAFAVSYTDLCKHDSTLNFQCSVLHDRNFFISIKKALISYEHTPARVQDICFI